MHALHRRVPDRRPRRAGRARRDTVPLVLDAGAGADSRSRTAPRSGPRSTAATSARTSARGTAGSRAGAPIGRPTKLRTSTSLGWLDAERSLDDDLLRRLYVPRNDPRWLRAQRDRRARQHRGRRPRSRRCAPQARRRRRRAARRARTLGARPAGGRMQLRGLERWISLLRLIAFPFVFAAVAFAELPAGLGAVGVGDDRRVLRRVVRVLPARPKRPRRPPPVRAEPRRPDLRHGRSSPRFVMVFAFERGLPVQQILYIDLAAACVRFGIIGGLILAAGLGADPRRLRRAARQPPAPALHLEARRVPDRARGADGADRRLARPAARRGGIARPRRGPRRPSGSTRPSGRPSPSCAGSRPCAPTSSRSSRTRCARRWRR